MKMVIVAGGTLLNPRAFKELMTRADRVVCADGGAAHLVKMGILPDVVIGDLDSMAPADRTYLETKKVAFIRHPVDKDDTDTALAARWAVDNGAVEITFLGATGTRLDHTLANVMLMAPLQAAGITCRMLDDHNEIYLITDQLRLTGSVGEYLSLIPLSARVTGVTLSGLSFPLSNATITRGDSLGVSNRFAAKTVNVSLKTGLLMVTRSRD